MSDTTLVNTLLSVEPREYVLVEGYPDDGETRWHVNNAISIGGADTGTQRAIVLQEGSGDDLWLVAIIEGIGIEPSLDMLSAFDGEPPQGFDAEDHGEPIDPDAISVRPAEDS